MLTPDGVEEVYRTHGHRLWRSLVLFSGDPEIASDALAEALAAALARPGDVRNPRAWITKVAFRTATKELRRRRLTVWLRAEAAYELPDPLPEVSRALRRLSPMQRRAVVLHHCAGYPVDEIAALLGSTPGAIGVHLHRGRSRLRELLEEPDGQV